MSPLYECYLSGAAYAHYYIFILLILAGFCAGFCLLISEDVAVLVAGIISVEYYPENTTLLFL